MSAHVLLNLLNESGKREVEHFISYHMLFYNIGYAQDKIIKH